MMKFKDVVSKVKGLTFQKGYSKYDKRELKELENPKEFDLRTKRMRAKSYVLNNNSEAFAKVATGIFQLGVILFIGVAAIKSK